MSSHYDILVKTRTDAMENLKAALLNVSAIVELVNSLSAQIIMEKSGSDWPLPQQQMPDNDTSSSNPSETTRSRWVNGFDGLFPADFQTDLGQSSSSARTSGYQARDKPRSSCPKQQPDATMSNADAAESESSRALNGNAIKEEETDPEKDFERVIESITHATARQESASKSVVRDAKSPHLQPMVQLEQLKEPKKETSHKPARRRRGRPKRKKEEEEDEDEGEDEEEEKSDVVFVGKRYNLRSSHEERKISGTWTRQRRRRNFDAEDYAENEETKSIKLEDSDDK